jgi:DNA-binding NarL/FixJ family response regulator
MNQSMTKGGPFVSVEQRRTAVVCDRYPLWLEAVESVLARVEIDVVAKATTVSGGVAAVRRLRPQLLVTDAVFGSEDGEPDGAILVEHALAEVAGMRAIVVSLTDRAGVMERAFAAGASAYVMKSAHPDDLASAARQAFDHSLFLPTGPTRLRAASTTSALAEADLTRREREILRLVAEGHSNAQLARMLWVTEQTVKFHLSNVYRKLDVSNRTEAARWAQLNGLLPESARDAA